MGGFFKLLRTFMSGGFLSGYRTYLLGFGLVLQAFMSWAVEGEQSAVQFLEQLPEILGGAGLMTARAALGKLLVEIRALRASLGDAEVPNRPGWNAAGQSPERRRPFSPAVLPAVLLPLLLIACGTTPEVRWAQAQTAYNDGVKGAIRYRAPCVDFGSDHPLCLIDDDTYRIIETIRERLDSLLGQADAAIKAGNEVGFDIYMTEIEKLLDTFLLYTVENLPRTSAIRRELRNLKAAIEAYYSRKDHAHHEADARNLRHARPASHPTGPPRYRAGAACGPERRVPRTATAALGRAGPPEQAVGRPGS